MAVAWPWATILSPSFSSIMQHPAKRCWSRSNYCSRSTRRVFKGTEQKIEFSESRPNPGDLRIEFLASAILLPSLSRNVSADTGALEKAIGAVDLKALDAADQRSL
jgi:hypothetical protein